MDETTGLPPRAAGAGHETQEQSAATAEEKTTMKKPNTLVPMTRRTVIKAAAAAGATLFAPPFIKARGEEPIKIGLDNPLTGTYAAPGKNELVGCQLAIEQIHTQGGILRRPGPPPLRGPAHRA